MAVSERLIVILPPVTLFPDTASLLALFSRPFNTTWRSQLTFGIQVSYHPTPYREHFHYPCPPTPPCWPIRTSHPQTRSATNICYAGLLVWLAPPPLSSPSGSLPVLLPPVIPRFLCLGPRCPRHHLKIHGFNRIPYLM